MSKKEKLLNHVLGKELYEALNKAIVKLNTKSVVDITEAHDSLKMVPKAVVTFLVKELKPMDNGESKEIELPFDDNAKLFITKDAPDVYHGKIVHNGKDAHDFNLCSLPQLASHLVSHFELYEEAKEEMAEGEAKKEESESSEESSSFDKEIIKQKLKDIENKINYIFSSIASKKEEFVIMPKDDFIKEHKKLVEVLESPDHKDDKEEAKEQKKELKEELGKNEGKKKIAKVLKKAGLAPKMPGPPRAGTNVGGMNGITTGGKHGPKTEFTDTKIGHNKMSMDVSNVKVPAQAKAQLKIPKQPSQPKQTAKSEKPNTLTVSKSEYSLTCMDCGSTHNKCSCFKGLSKPDIKKSENNITLKFKSDWNKEAVLALYNNLKRRK